MPKKKKKNQQPPLRVNQSSPSATRLTNLKSKLQAGGLTSAQQQQIAGQIRSLGGKVALGNFPAATDATPAGGGGGGTTPGAFGTGGGGARGVDPNVVEPGGLKNAGGALRTQIRIGNEVFNLEDLANRVNQTTPYGNREYGVDESGRTTVTDTLPPDVQAALDAQNQLRLTGSNLAAQNLANSMGGGEVPMTAGGSGGPMPGMAAATQGGGQFPGSAGGLGQSFNPYQDAAAWGLGGTFDPFQGQSGDAARQRIEDQVYSRLTRDIDQQQGQDVEALKQELQNRGIPIGSELYNKQMSEISKGYDRRRQEAMQDAVVMGGQEMTRLFNQARDTRNQMLYEPHKMAQIQADIRNQQIYEPQALAGMGGPIQNPAFFGLTQQSYAIPDVAGTRGTYAGIKQGQKGLDLQQQEINAILARMGGGGGGGAPVQQPQVPPINAGPIPGSYQGGF